MQTAAPVGIRSEIADVNEGVIFRADVAGVGDVLECGDSFAAFGLITPRFVEGFRRPLPMVLSEMRQLLIGLVALAAACGGRPSTAVDFVAEREKMVKEQIAARGVSDERVLKAMRIVPREEFVPEKFRSGSYDDGPLPIGHDQTISQPYVVALMTEQLRPQPTHRVLEVGTGSGYQAAVLSGLVAEVYSIEIVEPLGRSAESTLDRLGYKNVHVKIGDGYKGWPEHAPFDSIIVTCAPDHVPQPLIDQLKEGGRMVIPVGPHLAQELYVVHKENGQLRQAALLDVRFVPMIRGKAANDEARMTKDEGNPNN